MRKFPRFFSLLCIAFISFFIASIANAEQPTTFLGPTVRVGATNYLSDMTAYSVFGEAGVKNFRLNGTLAWQVMENQRIKVSADLLTQRIRYHFFSGNTSQWVYQGALGGYYEYDFMGCYNPIFDLSAYVSAANNRTLNDVSGTIIMTDTGLPNTFLNERRIAGSNADGAAIGGSIEPFCGTKVGLDLNYDNVRYNTHFTTNHDAKGFGGTAKLRQMLDDHTSLDFLAAVRTPFNYYKVDLIWSDLPFYGMWAAGVEGGYTAGKKTLPNTYNVLITLNYFFDRCLTTYKKIRHGDDVSCIACRDDFLAWAADPAVYMPEVLAIPDERVIIPDPRCEAPPPVVIAPIDDITLVEGDTVTIDGAAAFSPPTGLAYTETVTGVISPGTSVTFNPTTGAITIVAGRPTTLTITLTAANRCGQTATTTFTVTIETDLRAKSA